MRVATSQTGELAHQLGDCREPLKRSINGCEAKTPNESANVIVYRVPVNSNQNRKKERGFHMHEKIHEKIYGTMKNVGVGNLVFGIVSIVAGITIGVISIVNGAKLLKSKSNILF